MQLAIEQAATARVRASPNPWVGAVVVAEGRVVGAGATEPPGGRHAEVVALDVAGEDARGATLVVTLEPCGHTGRTGPCTEAIVESGIERVVVGVTDPDGRVSGRGISQLRDAGVDVEITGDDAVSEQLEPYLHHRRTGRPFVVAKLAASLDGGTAAPDGSSRWITGGEARADVHRLRAESDAILVGAGTVRADDPSLTVRHVEGRDPLRVVLGSAPAGARVHPCLEWSDGVEELLDELGGRGVLQLLVEGGASVLRTFHDLDLVDRYVVYIAPALFGGREMAPLLGDPTAPTIAELWRGRFDDAVLIGDDVRLGVRPLRRSRPTRGT
ncbi:MAG: bifunctional diaminohydroxyphosphoribosylaminopyrimidine deaminase/5-amino-6-(5-phosphoribosylamino)uracil reductase RibD [Ilumatobacter sp.]|nr:bifunctional diaminohydroxyphosphoribosylaminopyrimidine deaminase/5-amino-6-(5-phosphoribosylamino)uracil reductase RibD [Ilumatobacter sp.]